MSYVTLHCPLTAHSLTLPHDTLSPSTKQFQLTCHQKFEISAYSDSKEKEPVKDLVRQTIIPQLRKALGKFAGDLIAEHGKDIQHAPDSSPTSSSASPAPAKAASSAPQKPETPVVSRLGQVVNTVTLSDTAEFQTTAEELYTTFVDPQRVAAFTRVPPELLEPRVGGKFKLFGNNVEGEFLELEKSKSIVMKWRFGGWPAGTWASLNSFEYREVY